MENKTTGAIAVIFLKIVGLLLFLLTGCAAVQGKQTVGNTNNEPIDCSNAVEIILSPKEGAWDVLLQESFAEKKGGTNGNTSYEVDVCRRNDESGFYTVSHSEDMAQYTYLNQIYRVDLDTDSREILYETREAYWLNEFEATDNFLYWVEFVSPETWEEQGESLYRVMQYKLATGEAGCIAERNGEEIDEICLAVSEGYVAWYDNYRKEGRTEIVIYDSDKQEFHTLSGAKGFSSFARLDIVDGGITYLGEDEEGNTLINRYDLNTQRTDTLLLKKISKDKKIVECFSSERYVGWKLDDGAVRGYKYYVYDRENGSLYGFRGDGDISVFSEWISDYLYFNCHDTLYVCDPSSGRIWLQKLEGFGMQFREYGSGQVYLEVRTDDEAKLMTVHIPDQPEENEKQEEDVQTVLEQYFDQLYSTLLEDSDADYIADDFASINGYIIAKNLVTSRYTYHTLLGGIHEVDLKEVTIEDFSHQGDRLEVKAYVKYAFSYGDNEETSIGNLYRVTLERSGEQYKVTDLDDDDVLTRMAKEDSLARMEAAGATDPYPFIDAYFQQLKKNADNMLKMQKEMRN